MDPRSHANFCDARNKDINLLVTVSNNSILFIGGLDEIGETRMEVPKQQRVYERTEVQRLLLPDEVWLAEDYHSYFELHYEPDGFNFLGWRDIDVAMRCQTYLTNNTGHLSILFQCLDKLSIVVMLHVVALLLERRRSVVLATFLCTRPTDV
jgi:hypothetical protein